MTFPILFAVVIVGIQLFITISGKDAWPFSSYNMFSAPLDLTEFGVFRVALERQDGEIVWWRSHFYRYPEQVGKRIRGLRQLENDTPKTRMVVALETRKLLIEVARLIQQEEGGLESYQAFHIIERKPGIDRNNEIIIDDKTVARIPFLDLTSQFGEPNS